MRFYLTNACWLGVTNSSCRTTGALAIELFDRAANLIEFGIEWKQMALTIG